MSRGSNKQRIWCLSDTHFSHARSLEFKNEKTGVKMRPWEPGQVTEMNEYMVEKWNSVVDPADMVLHIGDTWFTKDGHEILSRLHGDKELIMGNHDDKATEIYSRYFRKLHGSYTVRSKNRNSDVILTHIPVHPSQFGRFMGNIHGHLHNEFVMMPDGVTKDPRYLNVCVENWDYTPILLRDAVDMIREARGSMFDVPVGR